MDDMSINLKTKNNKKKNQRKKTITTPPTKQRSSSVKPNKTKKNKKAKSNQLDTVKANATIKSRRKSSNPSNRKDYSLDPKPKKKPKHSRQRSRSAVGIKSVTANKKRNKSKVKKQSDKNPKKTKQKQIKSITPEPLTNRKSFTFKEDPLSAVSLANSPSFTISEISEGVPTPTPADQNEPRDTFTVNQVELKRINTECEESDDQKQVYLIIVYNP